MSTITQEDKDELLISCRYGDLEDVQSFVTKHGAEALAEVRDDNGNNILHMICANGHLDVLEYLLPIIPSTLLGSQNNSGSTALHWAALNSQLPVAQKLVQFPGGPGLSLIDIKNKAGHSPLGEAENAGWEEGAKWFVEVMILDAEGTTEQSAIDDEATLDTEDGVTRDIEVEIEDADGKIAKMTISGNSKSTVTSSDAPAP